MDVSYKIRRHGYHLMSLASLGLTGVAVFGALLTFMPWVPDWDPQWSGWRFGPGLEWKQLVGMHALGKQLLSTSAALWTAAQLIPLLALRQLGKQLYRNEALSRPVADAFRWLAHSLLLYAAFSTAARLLEGMAIMVDQTRGTFSIEFDRAYLFLIACLCLYSVAHLMRLTTDAADDVRAIV
ncbi:hypothetical protein H1235_05890 [Pseudoxanthomonas sp. NC8]|nr:hypothetical protein H1235_05890 [Pseudoxanthomonas sp. NC8]